LKIKLRRKKLKRRRNYKLFKLEKRERLLLLPEKVKRLKKLPLKKKEMMKKMVTI